VDSASILEGRGDGTFAPAVNFALGPDVSNPQLSQFRGMVGTLNTADINRDGHTDLIASHGRILFNVPPRENRPPIAYAGDDQWVSPHGDGYVPLYGGGTDPDFHLLSFDWGNAAPGNPPHVAFACPLLPEEPGTSVFTITADDGHGGVSSASVTVTKEGEPTQQLPEGWTAGDVGAVGAEGSASMDESGRLRVRGSGADVWGNADEFAWVHQAVTGDFEASVKVWSVEHVDVWTKAGLMLREGTAAGSRHASIFVTPSTTKGIAFQRRPTTNGTSVHTAGPAATAPQWIRLRRTGNVVSAYTSASGLRDQWTLVGRQTFTGLSNTVEVGVAVSSHRDGVLAEAVFDQPLILPSSSASWVTQDIGKVGLPGNIEYSTFPTAMTIEGSGADIWGTADAFRLHSQSWTLDGTVTARVTSVERTHEWAKAGVMFRETLAPGSRHVMLIVSPGKGLAMQYRASPGGSSANVALAPGVSAPEWVRLTRAGNRFTGYASEDGVTWRTIGAITIAMSGDTYAGLAVTSHNNAQLATAAFERLELRR
jgi:regulation of enolase protein 1 (concanavalin A-like superfamily)